MVKGSNRGNLSQKSSKGKASATSSRSTSSAAKGKSKAPSKVLPKAVVQADVNPLRHDILGISALGIAVFCLVILVRQPTGVLGEALSRSMAALFGRGAWLLPVGLTYLGINLIRGRKHHLGWMPLIGVLLMITAVLAGLTSQQGDFFDPDRVVNQGGYWGAITAAGFQALLGTAGSIIGYVTIGGIGLLCALNRPIRQLWEDWKFDGQLAPIQEEPEPEELPGRKRKLRFGSEDESSPRELRGKPEDIERDGKPDRNRSLPKGYIWDEPAAETPPAKVGRNPVIRDLTESKEDFQIEARAPKEGYQLPSLSVLAQANEKPKRTPQEMQRNIETIEGTLEQFGIDANVVEVATGPTITRYEIQLGPGIRVARIVSLADNIAMDMAASMVRVEAPIPGKAAIGLEIPNVKPTAVNIRELVESKEFLDHPSRLCVTLGKDVGGENRYADLTKMPHLLIAGATNSGKSIGLASLITSLLMRNTPKDLRLVMIDPKRVELTLFDQIPHLLCPVIKDVKEAPGVLRAVWREMDRRYDLLSEKGVRNIDGWNAKASYQDKLPYIVVIIDELADLMIQAKAEVETSIVRLAQLARAVGIHLVIATQRPSVDVITGTIKANIPSRIAFAVASQIDSRTILDSKGAEALIGRGDMLFMPIDANKPVRIQGCYVSEQEIEQICNHWRSQESPNYAFDPSEFEAAEPERERGDFGENTDPMWEDVVRYTVEQGKVSTSTIQRVFRLGFQRSSRLIDQMEARGIVGPKDGSRPREVLVGLAELETLFGGTSSNTYEMGINIDDWDEAD